MTIYSSVAESSFWENVFPGLASGIVSGLVVALALALLQKLRAPLFELRKSDDNRANLKYNGWFPIQLGENWEFEEGVVLTTPTPKAHLAGDYVGRATRKTVAFERLTPGEGVTISFRRLLRSRGNRLASGNCPDVTTIRNSRLKFFGWKTYRLELTAGD